MSFSDEDYYIFAVSNNIQIRILAAKLEYIKENSRHILENIIIDETFISINDMKEISNKLNKYKINIL